MSLVAAKVNAFYLTRKSARISLERPGDSCGSKMHQLSMNNSMGPPHRDPKAYAFPVKLSSMRLGDR